MQNRILVIDDEKAIQELLHVSLSNKGFEVKSEGTARGGIIAIKDFHPHLIVLDLGLPDQPGLAVLKSIREWTDVPVLVLTVTDAESSKVALLEAGADDYITKPFSVPELVARINVALKHQRTDGAIPNFKSQELEVDLLNHEVRVQGNGIALTATEFKLLRMLIKNGGRVVPQAYLLSEIWGTNAIENSHYIRIYIKQLRKKLEKDPASPKHIITEPGVGYRIV